MPTGTSVKSSPPQVEVQADILIVEDNLDDAILLGHALQQGGIRPDPAVVHTMSEFKRVLPLKRWDLILSDYYLGAHTALQVLASVKEHGLHTPVVIVTNGLSQELTTSLIGAGAAACVSKGSSASLLTAIAKGLRDERHQLVFEASLLDSVQNAVIATDPNGVIVLWNKFAERLYGWKKEEVFGKNILSITVQPQHKEQSLQFMDSLFKTGFWEGEFEVARKDGTTFVAGVQNSLIRDQEGNIKGVVGISFDLTEKINLQRQLFHSQKMECIGRLAGGIAHDFNNILTIVQGYASLIALHETPLPEEILDAARTISVAAEKAGRLTRQMLLFSRKHTVQLTFVNLNDVVADMAKMLRRVVGEDVALQQDLAARLPTIKADEGMLEQVILNLAINARDAMPGGGTLSFRTVLRPCGQEHHLILGERGMPEVCLEITDSGCGICEADIPKIFEPFFTTKDAAKGTGLGLATVYAIVEQHQGSIAISSVEGKGTTFVIGFPPALEAVRLIGESSATLLEQFSGAGKILLVEDEEMVRRLTAHLLRKHGYQVLEAVSAAEAMELAAKEAGIDLLLTDIVLPGGMNGRELARQLSRRWSQLNILFISGYSGEVFGAAEASQPLLIQKPFRVEELLRRIATAIKG